VFVPPRILICTTVFGWRKGEGRSVLTSQRIGIAPREKSWSPFIPVEVLAQLKDHLHELPDPVKGMVMLLLECGLRVSELCALPVDCLMLDASGNPFLRCTPSRECGERILPLSQATAHIIQEQQVLAQKKQGVQGLLFLDPAGQAIGPRILMKQINRLAVEMNIRDSSGVAWRFRTRQFRATVAKHLVEQHVPFEVLRQYFGRSTLHIALEAHLHIFLGHRYPDTLSRYLLP
jgi:integrase/recombinase XerD